MLFTKMHGAGNEFLLIDGLDLPLPPHLDFASIAARACDRSTGPGADGLIVLEHASGLDARMRIFNADGSEAGACGNGLRCVGKYLYDHKYIRRKDATIATASGKRELTLEVVAGEVVSVSVWMGNVRLEARGERREDKNTQARSASKGLQGPPPDRYKIWPLQELRQADLSVVPQPSTVVQVGNPHCVFFVDELSDELIHELGPAIETHPAFPDRTNVEFARINSRTDVALRVWERGVGETAACGTGACAAIAAGIHAGLLNRDATCHLPGGDLQVSWINAGSQIRLTGPAVTVGVVAWEQPDQFAKAA
ncbi:diaminopimelate epimerase [Stratiformator vulcanicus]|uniref:Diaminopimelate epimerase n=1 Tax=Stratiformator vulcanicus TaxID=2527980 RepID=A0A517R7X6_9PLAN|nr:diaminopimelate epimerase [Stratiformator vulcanicus]QDT39933.1 Diaminopimelate epimerase [Stratiformator vulcanicus]